MKPTPHIIALLFFITASYAGNEEHTGFFRVADAPDSTTREFVYTHGDQERKLLIDATPLAAQSDIDFIERIPETSKGIKITLTKRGNLRFEDNIKSLKGKEMAIIIDGKVILVAVLQSTHFGGTFTLDDCVNEAEAAKIVHQFKK